LVLWIGLDIQFQRAVIPLSSECEEGRNELEETYNSLLYPLSEEIERRGLKKDDVVSATLSPSVASRLNDPASGHAFQV
jgi:hypothetical protein